MAIKNASDLLVYKKTSPLLPQITRIKVKSSTPLKDFTSGQNIIINNTTDASGDINDGEVDNLSTNSGAHITASLKTELEAKDYTVTGVASSGGFHFIDATNGADGPVPTLEIVDGTAEFKAGAIVIDVIQSGQSLVYQPIAYSTSASISMSTDLRDITTKDSQGWQENAKGLGSFEMSTDALWDVNNAVGVESAVNDLVSGDSVDVKFSDRVRNLIDNEEVYGDVAYWSTSNVTLTKHLEDPFGQFTAAQVDVSSDGANRNYRYNAPIALLEGKRVTWSLYLKAFSAQANSCEFKIILDSDSGTDVSFHTSIEKISGTGTTSSTSGTFKKVTGLSTTSWTRVKVTTDSVVSGTDLRNVQFLIYPGADHNNQTTADKVITASWQVETGTSATDYQNPTEVDCYQGKAFVNSVSIDAGTEENATYSASFTGTSELFVNGLGHELVGDPYFDDGTNWWSTSGESTISNGVARILSTAGVVSAIFRSNILTVNEKYCLEYTVSNYTSGVLNIVIGLDQISIPSSVGTHKIYFTPISPENDLVIKRGVFEGSTICDISLNYVSIKQVFS